MKRTAGGCRKEAPSFSSNPRVHFFYVLILLEDWTLI